MNTSSVDPIALAAGTLKSIDLIGKVSVEDIELIERALQDQLEGFLAKSAQLKQAILTSTASAATELEALKDRITSLTKSIEELAALFAPAPRNLDQEAQEIPKFLQQGPREGAQARPSNGKGGEPL
jgi:hypothetical protein